MTRVASDSRPDRPYESLRSTTRFREVMRRGTTCTIGGVTVVSLPTDDPIVRVGLVAGRRLGGAVHRNRIKRRLRHACRQVRFEPGWDHVLIPSRAVAAAPFRSLVAWIEEAVRREA